MELHEAVEHTPDEERKEAWLTELASFIVEANRNTWAAGKGKVKVPQRPGCKELDYQNGDWHLHDSYAGYFSAPGMTLVYYKDKPVWSMSYGGKGMEDDRYGMVDPTFDFLKEALMRVKEDLPYRGPKNFELDGWRYKLNVNGDLACFEGKEKIFKGKDMVFSQVIFGGVVIGKDSDRLSVLPWNI